MPKLPLEGIRIVDITVVWAGPFATQVMADLGAEVIKVENVHIWQTFTRGFQARPSKELISTQVPMVGGYPDREPGDRPWNRSPLHNSLYRNKLSMTVDLRIPKGMEILKRLIQKSDVVYENNVPETMEKLGITYDWLKEIKEDIIFIRVPAYGLSGPYKNYRALGVHLESVIGHNVVRGYPDMDPSSNSAVYMGDYVAGVQGAFAVMAALHYHNRTGKGQLIEMAQAEGALPMLGEMIMDYTMNNRVQGTLGNRDMHGAAPCGCYRCKGEDRWINITVSSDEEWEGLCKVMGNPPWTQEGRFSDQLNRAKNQDELDALLEKWTVNYDSYELMHLLQKEGVPAGPVMTAPDCFNDPHLKERGFFHRVSHPEAGTHLYPGFLFRISDIPMEYRKPPCRMGGDNEYVYKKVLGISDEEYTQLEAEGHIGMDFDPHIR